MNTAQITKQGGVEQLVAKAPEAAAAVGKAVPAVAGLWPKITGYWNTFAQKSPFLSQMVAWTGFNEAMGLGREALSRVFSGGQPAGGYNPQGHAGYPGYYPQNISTMGPYEAWKYSSYDELPAEVKAPFDFGVEAFCKHANFDDEDREAMFGLIRKHWDCGTEKQAFWPAAANLALGGVAAHEALSGDPWGGAWTAASMLPVIGAPIGAAQAGWNIGKAIDRNFFLPHWQKRWPNIGRPYTMQKGYMGIERPVYEKGSEYRESDSERASAFEHGFEAFFKQAGLEDSLKEAWNIVKAADGPAGLAPQLLQVAPTEPKKQNYEYKGFAKPWDFSLRKYWDNLRHPSPVFWDSGESTKGVGAGLEKARAAIPMPERERLEAQKAQQIAADVAAHQKGEAVGVQRETWDKLLNNPNMTPEKANQIIRSTSNIVEGSDTDIALKQRIAQAKGGGTGPLPYQTPPEPKQFASPGGVPIPPDQQPAGGGMDGERSAWMEQQKAPQGATELKLSKGRGYVVPRVDTNRYAPPAGGVAPHEAAHVPYSLGREAAMYTSGEMGLSPSGQPVHYAPGVTEQPRPVRQATPPVQPPAGPRPSPSEAATQDALSKGVQMAHIPGYKPPTAPAQPAAGQPGPVLDFNQWLARQGGAQAATAGQNPAPAQPEAVVPANPTPSTAFRGYSREPNRPVPGIRTVEEAEAAHNAPPGAPSLAASPAGQPAGGPQAQIPGSTGLLGRNPLQRKML
jgi:hypothetical protein